MADPRNTLAFDGIDAERATFAYDSSIVYDSTKAGGSASVGLAVYLTGDRTVGLTVDASTVLGQVQLVEDDTRCTVQIEGVCTLPAGASATVTAGSKIVGALGAASAPGYIRNVAAATLAEVAVARGQIYDASDATAVAVDF